MKQLFTLIICFGLINAALGEEANHEKPNIILLLVDDMGYGDIAAHGNPVLKTPNFDRLHAQSVRFTDFLVSPTCSPTRAALMSGMHELKVGVDHTIEGRNRMELDALILPQIIKQAGYSTAIFGKWHLGMDQEAYRPDNRGFDVALNHPADNQRPHYDLKLLRNGKEEQHKGYRTDIFFNEAMSYIETQNKKKDERFFCYLATFTPHSPLVVPEKYSRPYEGKSKYPGLHGMVANVDENIGRLLAKLDELGIADDTLLIVMGDNGGTYGIDTWNAGMRGAKANAYHGGVRTFCFWRWPKRLKPGTRDQLTCHHDVLPTLAALTGVALEPAHKQRLDGYDLNPLLQEDLDDWAGKDRMIVHHSARWSQGKAAEHKYAFCGVRHGKFHLMRQYPCDDPNCGKKERAVICKLHRQRMADPSMQGFYADRSHYKLTEPGKWSLFDLATDRHEDQNIVDTRPEVVERMAQHFDQWWSQFDFDPGHTNRRVIRSDRGSTNRN